MTPFQMSRYLDYCSELLSLTSKLAAFHAQYLRDQVILSAVNDIKLAQTLGASSPAASGDSQRTTLANA
jgi:hypothetical protein